MTSVPEDPRHVHDRRYSQLNHRHRRLEEQIDDKADADHTHPSIVTGEWRYATNTTMADPGSGYIRIADDDSQIAIHYTNNGGTDTKAVFQEFAAGDTLRIQDKDDASVYRTYEMTGGVDNDTWALLDVTPLTPEVTAPPRNNDPVMVTARIGVNGGGTGGYVRRQGDTMTGMLTLADDPTEPMHAATKQFVEANGGGTDDHSLLINLDKDDHGHYAPIHVIDAADPDPTEHQRPGQIVVRKGVAVNEGLEFLQKQGGTMTGPLLLQSEPASDMEAATRQYVDTCIMEEPGSGPNHSLTICRLYRSGGMVHAEINGTVSTTPGAGTQMTGTISDQFLPPASLGDVFLTIAVYTGGTAAVASISNAIPYIRWRGVTFPQGSNSITLNASWPVRID